MLRAFILSLVLLPVCALTVVAETSAAETVRYRLENWKAKHIHDVAKADQLTDILKKLGCEVQKAEHNGHIDVKYRCPQWRQISPETEDEVVRWEKWLRQHSFQTERKPKPAG
jgi:hypothetical protein